MSKTPAAVRSGRRLFAAIWKKVNTEFFDQERLIAIDWAGQRLRYNKLIVDDASAIVCAEKMLLLLNDRYSRMLEPKRKSSQLKPTKAKSAKSKRVKAVAGARVLRVDPLIKSKVMADGIGYLGINSFSHVNIAARVQHQLKRIKDCAAFVIDLRGNTGGMVDATCNALEYFIDESSICYTDKPIPAGLQQRYVFFRPDNFCLLILEPGVEPDLSLYLRQAPMIAGKPMVLLIDGDTLSAAEMFAAAILGSGTDGSIIAMGTKSGGKGIGQSNFTIRGKATLRLSCMRLYNPDGHWVGDHGQTVGSGIVPQVELPEGDNPVEAIETAAKHLKSFLSNRPSKAKSGD